VGDSVDLHFDRRLRQRRDLDQCAYREITGENFSARLPDLLALCDVSYEDRDFHDVGYDTACRLDQAADLGKK
jgi:hypothetical protein